MKVLKYAVNKEPELINIENGLEAMQYEVDGYIETVAFPSVNAVLVCNEEGTDTNNKGGETMTRDVARMARTCKVVKRMIEGLYEDYEIFDSLHTRTIKTFR